MKSTFFQLLRSHWCFLGSVIVTKNSSFCSWERYLAREYRRIHRPAIPPPLS
jgi:hypothetical protein